jgi:hypothetical protein
MNPRRICYTTPCSSVCRSGSEATLRAARICYGSVAPTSVSAQRVSLSPELRIDNMPRSVPNADSPGRQTAHAGSAVQCSTSPSEHCRPLCSCRLCSMYVLVHLLRKTYLSIPHGRPLEPRVALSIAALALSA